MRWLIIAVFLFLSIWKLSGQVEISASFDQDSIVIGNEVSFTLSLEVDSDVEVLGVATYFLDSIYSALQTSMARVDTTAPVVPMVADFEMISDAGWKDLNDDGVFAGDELSWNITANGNKRLFEQTFTIKLWDPGDNIALYPTVLYLQEGEQMPTNIQEQFSVFVTPPLGVPLTQDSMKVAPIKTIKEEATNISDYLIYFIIIGLAIVLGLIYWLYARYLKNKEKEEVIIEEVAVYVPTHEVAMEKLTDLRSKELWQKGEIKLYQSELTRIIREYLEGRYNIAALESTTDEIVKKLSKELSEEGDVVSLKRILQVADLVKFAKATPDENLHESFMVEAESFVQRTGDEEVKIRIQ